MLLKLTRNVVCCQLGTCVKVNATVLNDFSSCWLQIKLCHCFWFVFKSKVITRWITERSRPLVIQIRAICHKSVKCLEGSVHQCTVVPSTSANQVHWLIQTFHYIFRTLRKIQNYMYFLPMICFLDYLLYLCKTLIVLFCEISWRLYYVRVEE